ncbi:MAG: hypothetical protein IJX75_01010 [Clostridia bacterium]|nr:hypothetical protein [Clostridia bacterium]
MKKDVWLWQLAGFAFATALGTLLHFLYDWTDLSIFTPISAVNESTWEHMKILFFPMLIFAFFQSVFFRNDYPNFWWIQLTGIFVGVISVPVLFYTYNGAFGKTPDWLNVLFFFISSGGAYLLQGFLFRRPSKLDLDWIALAILLTIAAVFVAFTYYPPYLPLFQDPITGGYGLTT